MSELIFSYGLEETFTPLDGRNRHKLKSLTPYLSELALTKYRISIEVAYLQKLTEIGICRKITTKEKKLLSDFVQNLSRKDYKKIRVIEQSTNHEMKSVEEFIKEALVKTTLKDIASFVHFGLTSEDINNLAYALMLKDSMKNVIIPEIEKIQNKLLADAKTYKSLRMLGRTHGQPALPTTLGKEYLVFAARLQKALAHVKRLDIEGKLTGNIGNFNAQAFVYPKINWLTFSRDFVTSLGLTPNIVTTQINPYDSTLRIFQEFILINTLLIGLCQDFWWYISMGYFTQQVVKKEVGSTALPHKVNPIYFEGAEGGFGVANALFTFFVQKLSYSRLQRDLSDSTVRRSFPIALCYSFLSYQSVGEALSRIVPNKEKLAQDLTNHAEILSEAIQNFLRTRNYTDAYDKTKQFFRGKNVTQADVHTFISSLDISQKDKETLYNLTPETYSGYAEKIVTDYEK